MGFGLFAGQSIEIPTNSDSAVANFLPLSIAIPIPIPDDRHPSTAVGLSVCHDLLLVTLLGLRPLSHTAHSGLRPSNMQRCLALSLILSHNANSVLCQLRVGS